MSHQQDIPDPNDGSAVDPDLAGIEPAADAEADTEGHSYLSAELARQTARDRAREADELQRANALGRQVSRPRRSLRDRLLGR